MSDFLDDDLDAQTAWQVQAHVAGCDSCARTQRELSALRGALRALPGAEPSAGFDAALAGRLALTRRPAPARRMRLAALQPAPKPFRWPALALGAACAAGALLLTRPTPPPPAPAPVRAAAPVDRAFVADCVAQRRREAVGEPLADLSAQNLAGRLDASEAGADTEAAAPAGDGEAL